MLHNKNNMKLIENLLSTFVDYIIAQSVFLSSQGFFLFMKILPNIETSVNFLGYGRVNEGGSRG